VISSWLVSALSLGIVCGSGQGPPRPMSAIRHPRWSARVSTSAGGDAGQHVARRPAPDPDRLPQPRKSAAPISRPTRASAGAAGQVGRLPTAVTLMVPNGLTGMRRRPSTPAPATVTSRGAPPGPVPIAQPCIDAVHAADSLHVGGNEIARGAWRVHRLLGRSSPWPFPERGRVDVVRGGAGRPASAMSAARGPWPRSPDPPSHDQDQQAAKRHETPKITTQSDNRARGPPVGAFVSPCPRRGRAARPAVSGEGLADREADGRGKTARLATHDTVTSMSCALANAPRARRRAVGEQRDRGGRAASAAHAGQVGLGRGLRVGPGASAKVAGPRTPPGTASRVGPSPPCRSG